MLEGIERDEWNTFVASRQHAQFLQSWEWGEFQKSLGVPIYRAGARDAEGLPSACSLFLELPVFGKEYYMYSPRGPVAESLDVLVPEVIARYSQKRYRPLFIRFEPLQKFIDSGLQKSRARKSMPIQPDREWIIDLTKEEHVYFQEMHQKTRYNIRLSKKRGVHVRTVENSMDARERAIDHLYSFLIKTAEQKEYRLHPKSYYTSLITFFSQASLRGSEQKSPSLRLYEAVYGGETIASICMIYFGDTAYYLYGGSDMEHRSLMAPFALHAEAIEDARIMGFRYYNFGGVAPRGSDRHPLAGITRFKTSFGGEQFLYPGTFDFILSYPGYMVYQIGRPLWRMFNRIRAPIV